MAGGQGAAVTGAAMEHRGGSCLDRLRVMTFNANGLFTVTPRPEYKYCKILKAACKLSLDILLVQETRVNGLVDWHVRDVEQGEA